MGILKSIVRSPARATIIGFALLILTGTYVLKDDEALILLGPNDALDSIRKKEE